MNTKRKKTGRKLLSVLLSLAMVVGLLPGMFPDMSLTAYAADEVSENISLVTSDSAHLNTISGTHYSVSTNFEANSGGMTVNNAYNMTINARKGETITKVVLSYSWGTNKGTLSASAGTFDGNATVSGINAQQVTISSSHAAGVHISAVTVYFEGSLSNPTVTLSGGANAKNSGGLLTQSYLPGAMDTVTYTALTGATFPEFEKITQNGITVERTSETVVTVSGTPTTNTEITVPDAESSSKIVTWNSATISSISSSSITIDYTYTANGITLNKTGKGKFSNNDIQGFDSTALFEFTTATGKFTSIEIETSQIYDGGNWTKDGNTLKWNSTPSDSVSLSGTINVEGISSITFVIEMPTVAVTITPGSNMTKTTDSGEASQSDLSGAMKDVVYTADNGYYFPTDYSVAEVSGIKVTRDSYTQITVSGTPTADAAIALTAPTAKTTPDAPTTANATDCTTADNNDGTLTGVTTAMEYKKSDAADWTAGTGSDITGLVPGTYYVRVKATETTNASTNQELTIKGFISYTVTFKVVNGKWNEGEGDAATADKTVTLTGHDGDTLKLTADQIPAVGTKPNDTYKAGSWDTTPSADTAITGATTYTYTYAQKDTISQTVTFKVINGKWDDDTTADKTVTLTGYEGDTLKLAVNQIPAVGSKPNDTYKAGSWDVMPNTGAAITEATTYTYTYSQKDSISRTVTFKVINGKWDDDTTADKTVTLTGYEGDTLKLAANQIPAVGTKPNDTYKAGSWDVTPSTETEITAATTYTYTYAQKDAISQTVTFKVVNGSWNDETTTDKTVTLTGYEGDTLKLTADQIPTVGTKPNDTYKAGSWDATPSTDTAITAATTYTYTYAHKDSISQTVTFKVVNGKWDDDSTADKTVTLIGYEGDTLKLASNQIPAVGTKPNDTYKAGSWDMMPNTDAAITEATTYTYTYVAKEASVVTKAPEAKTLTYNGQAQELVTAGTATGGEMQYALGNATEATGPYTTSIPTGTDAGTYYVWYKVKSDNNHNDTDAACTTVTISPADNSELITAINDAKTFYESIEKEYPAVAKELKTALDKAEAVAGSNTSTPENISDATEALDTALNLAKDKAEFEKYKTTKETEAGNLAKTDDSDASKALITKAQQDIASATYDTEKTLEENKAAVNTIITDLKSVLDTQRAVDKDAADKAAADKVIEAINTLPAKEDVTASDKEAVEAARAAYDALTASQKDKIDIATLQKLADAEEALVALGELDKNVVAFNSEKNVQKAEAVKLAKEDDSDAVRKLIADAREAIDALAYDKNKSLDENKAALAAIVTELGNALEEQRELEKILAVVKIDQGETVAEVDTTAIKEEDVETVTNVAKSTDADLSEAATTCVKQIVEESETVEDSDKNIVIVPALDVKGKEYSVTETDATMTLDIEAVYTSYETTSDIKTAKDVKSATEAADETEKAKVKEIGSGKLDTEGTPVNVKIEVPAAFAGVLGATTETVKASPATIYVKHTHKNKNYEYNASLYCEGSKYFVEFVNPNGFSPFTLSGNSASVASIGDKNYTDLQSAIDDAADGSTIKLTNDNDVSATINTEKTITIDKDSHTGNVDIKAADTFLLTKTDNENGTTTYKTVTKYTVTFDNNGGKGTMPAQEIGGTAALNANAFTKEGYTFDGWNIKSDGSGTAYADKADVTPTADMTLYAQWKENPKPDDKDKTDAEVEAVKTKINALKAADKITTADKADIEAADKAYDALSEARKKLIDAATLKKLTDAKAALKAAEKAESDKAAADAVKTRINALKAADKITTTDKAAVEEARKAYDALSADQKKLVDAATLKKLTDAEKALTTAEANDKASKELEAAKQEAQAAMNEQVTVTQKGNKFTVKWKKASSADGYYVYASYCGKKATKPAKTVKKNTTTKVTISKINGKKISTKKNFHVYVVPYKIIDGKKVALGKSTVAHLVGAKSTKYSNVKKLTLKKTKYTVKVGKTAKIKAKVTLVNKNKKHIPKSHGAKFRYKSSDTSIATVDKNGKIKGIKKGKCTIYVYSINGLMKKAKITVK